MRALRTLSLLVGAMAVVTAGASLTLARPDTRLPAASGGSRDARAHALELVREGREIFRHDTFGDEAFWGDTLKLHQAIAGAAHGGVGAGISPATALALGLKVDVQALPGNIRQQLRRGNVDVDDPATTLALLQQNA